ncbi:hypothetical protein ISCGN_010424 [Ixodes scapularis]
MRLLTLGRPSNFKDRPDFVPTVFNRSRAPGDTALQPYNFCVERQEVVGMKLRCKYCQVELNSMNQYEEHMKSKNHKLRMEGKVLNPEKKMKKASKKFYKKWSKDEKKDDNEDAEKEKPSSDKADAEADKAEEVDPKKAKVLGLSPRHCRGGFGDARSPKQSRSLPRRRCDSRTGGSNPPCLVRRFSLRCKMKSP